MASALLVAGHWLPGLDGTPVEFGIRDSLHVIAFAGFALIVFGLIRSGNTTIAAVATLATCAAVGVTAEYLQFVRGSSANNVDVMRDVAGAVLMLAAILLWRQSKSGNGKAWLRPLAVTVASLVFAPLVFWLVVATLNYRAAPGLISFDKWWELHTVWQVRTKFERHDGLDAPGRAGRFALSPDSRTGISIFPVSTDWHAYRYLAFTATMERGPDTPLSIRINDGDRFRRYSGAFTHEVLVTGQPTRIRLALADLARDPDHEAMDLSNIRQLSMLAPRRSGDIAMVLDEIRLE